MKHHVPLQRRRESLLLSTANLRRVLLEGLAPMVGLFVHSFICLSVYLFICLLFALFCIMFKSNMLLHFHEKLVRRSRLPPVGMLVEHFRSTRFPDEQLSGRIIRSLLSRVKHAIARFVLGDNPGGGNYPKSEANKL